MSKSVLLLKNYGVSVGDKTILSSVSLDVPEKGIFNILGPVAAGKSTLIRTLSGVNNSNPNIKSWGKAEYLGVPIGETDYPALVMQNAKLMMSSIMENILSAVPDRNDLNGKQQRELACHLLEMANMADLVNCLDTSAVDLPLETMRHLALARVCVTNPCLVFIDEPTMGIKNDSAHKILEYIKAESDKRAIVIVTHNMEQARVLGGRTALLAEGQVQEVAPTNELFSSPESVVAKYFIENHTCSISEPDKGWQVADIKDTKQIAHEPVDIKNNKNDISGQKQFVWLKEREIAGMSQPGTNADLERDLEFLQKIGVTHLISLASEQGPIDPGLLARYGISSIYEPIDDLTVPTVEQASFLCEEIGHLISKGNVVAIHSTNGLGRTGVVLASHLMWEGQSLSQALESVRKKNPEWVQSEEQILFLKEFARETAGESGYAMVAGE